MLAFSCVFTKGGIVLWSNQSDCKPFTPFVNDMIREGILEQKMSKNPFRFDQLTLHYKMDNEFDFVLVVGYKKILQFPFIDELLNDVHLELKTKCKKKLRVQDVDFGNFKSRFEEILMNSEIRAQNREKIPKQMRTYEESAKFKRARGHGDKGAPKNSHIQETINGSLKKKNTANPKENAGSLKKARVWNPCVEIPCNTSTLEYSAFKEEHIQAKMKLDPLVVIHNSGKGDERDNEDELTRERLQENSLCNIFKDLVGSKLLSHEALQPLIERMMYHLISKNVAVDIAEELCNAVVGILEGRVVGPFENVTGMVKSAMSETLEKLLCPKRRVNILRDCMQAQQDGRPFVMLFCGVNGVGKSTNLAKICFWLIENNMSVVIAACDTFRAGAVEQLRSHTHHLNALHLLKEKSEKPVVHLYEKGYGKDAAGLAKEAIKHATKLKIDVVLIDTAGRMPSNSMLMRELAKIIYVNKPDKVLFVGEALVGNEAISQLVKFNQGLSEHGSPLNPRTINGIVLSKFDTVGDKVGAAITMTYVTGEPIIFVGTGQTYADLKALNVSSIVKALMK